MVAGAVGPSMAGLLGALHGLLAGLPAGAGGPSGAPDAAPAAPPPAAKPAPVRPVMPPDRLRWTFSTGNVIFRNGRPIDPQSAEGRTIESIYERQRRDREANARQRAHVAALRQSAIPRAVVEGRAGMDAIKLGPGLTLNDLFTQRTTGGIVRKR